MTTTLCAACPPLDGLVARLLVGPGARRLSGQVTLVVSHPGGADAALDVEVPAGTELTEVGWRNTRLTYSAKGTMVSIALPYMSGACRMNVVLRFRAAVRGDGVRLLRLDHSLLPLPPGVLPTMRVGIKLAPGLDLVATRAPILRNPTKEGGLACAFPDVPAREDFVAAVVDCDVETTYIGGLRIETAGPVSGRTLSLVARGLKAVSFLAQAKQDLKSLSLVVDPEAGECKEFRGLAVLGAGSQWEFFSKALSLALSSWLDWSRDRRSQWLKAGLVRYFCAAAAGRRRTSAVFTRHVERASKALKRHRPAPRWRRWRRADARKVGADRGFGLIFMLRGMAGAAHFRNILSALSRCDRISAGAFETAATKELGCSLDWLFEAFLEKGFLPDVVVEDILVEEQRRPVEMLYDAYGEPSDAGRYLCEIRLLQTGELPFDGPVGLRIETDTGKLDTRVRLAGRMTKLRVFTARPPRRIVADPAGWLIESNEKNNILEVPAI